MTTHPHVAKPSEGPQGSQGAEETYTVGYCRPPIHTRVKPGQVLKGGGRPKGQCNVGTVLRKALNERTKIREHNRTRSVTKLDGLILKMIADAALGNPKAQANVIALMRAAGLVQAPEETKHQEPLTVDDQALIADFFQRNGKTPAAPQESKGKPQDENPAATTEETKS